ncbi:MAG: Anti-sigma-I factor RsgI [Firmicutes bacterium ADurb.Bin419]|nr:MAG: Anti-sigma-I factor RsgI [Firmicutes bacterium ADurb.Bin419]
MKGIVVEQNDKYAVILDKNGGFIKIKNRGNYSVGHEIDIEAKVFDFNFKTISKVASIAAAFVLVSGVSVGAYAYNTPCNYVNVDINPSLEFSVNIFDRVLEVKGINSDGEELVKYKSYKNLRIDKAVENCIEEAVEEGFLGESSDNAVVITVSGKDNKKVTNIKEELANTANVTLEQGKVQSEVLTEETTLGKRDAAKELGISPGKLVLIEKLKEVKPDVEVKEYKDKKVKEIVASINETKKSVEQKKNSKPKVDEDKLKDREKVKKDNNTVDKPGKNNTDKNSNDKKDKEIDPKTDKKNSTVEQSKSGKKDESEKNKESLRKEDEEKGFWNNKDNVYKESNKQYQKEVINTPKVEKESKEKIWKDNNDDGSEHNNSKGKKRIY